MWTTISFLLCSPYLFLSQTNVALSAFTEGFHVDSGFISKHMQAGKLVKKSDVIGLLGEGMDFDELSEESLARQVHSVSDVPHKNGETLASCFGLWPLAGSSTIIYDYADDGDEIITDERKRRKRFKLKRTRKRSNRTRSKKNKKTIRAKEKMV